MVKSMYNPYVQVHVKQIWCFHESLSELIAEYMYVNQNSIY